MVGCVALLGLVGWCGEREGWYLDEEDVGACFCESESHCLADSSGAACYEGCLALEGVEFLDAGHGGWWMCVCVCGCVVGGLRMKLQATSSAGEKDARFFLSSWGDNVLGLIPKDLWSAMSRYVVSSERPRNRIPHHRQLISNADVDHRCSIPLSLRALWGKLARTRIIASESSRE